jgi:hypothetical protein
VEEVQPPQPAAEALKPEPVPAAKNKETPQEKDSTKIALETPSGTMNVERPTKRHATAQPAPAPPPKMKKIAPSGGKGGKADDALSYDRELGGVEGGAVGGVASGGAPAATGRGAMFESAKSSAPSTAAPQVGKAEEQKQQRSSRGYGYGLAASESPPPPAGASAPAAPAPEREQAYRSQAAPQAAASAPVQSVTAPRRDIEGLRKRAEEAAKSGRCEEAIKLYQQLDGLSQYISPQERVHYVHCLTATNRQEQAQQALDELKYDKRVTNVQLQQVEKELLDARRRTDTARKAAKKPSSAAPADRAAQQQQRPAEPAPPPAQAAPPRARPSADTRSPAY